MTTYYRKYYLIREIKKAGFKLHEHKNERIILVTSKRQHIARKNKHVQELLANYQYGVQITLNL